MKFIVNFMSPKETEIVQHMGAAGLDILDILREKFPKLVKMPLDKIQINTHCPVARNICQLVLTEEQVRETELFNGKSQVDVRVPESFFSQFIDWSYEEVREEVKNLKFLKGKLKRIQLRQVMDMKGLFKAWEEVEFTRWWGVERPSTSSTKKTSTQNNDGRIDYDE